MGSSRDKGAVLEVRMNRWDTIGGAVSGFVVGAGFCTATLFLGSDWRYGLGGLVLILLGFWALSLVRRPTIIVDGEGIWWRSFGKVLFEELESVTVYKRLGYQGLKIRLKSNPVRSGRKGGLAWQWTRLMSLFGVKTILLACDRLSASANEIFETIERQRAMTDR